MITIVLADSHQLVREGLRCYLEAEADLTVVAEAANGLDTVGLAQEHRPDIVVMDIAMPQLNGIEATRKITAGGSKTKVIGLSQHDEARLARQMMRAGAAGFLPKACAARELVRAIRFVNVGRAYFGTKMAGLATDDGRSVRTPAQETVFDKLSGREREVLQLVVEGHTAKEVAAHLQVSHRTANTHRENLMAKLGIRNLVDLVKYALRKGITTP